VAPNDVGLSDDGRFEVAGARAGVSWAEVARAAAWSRT
jgi:hypothetical protein